MKKIVLTTLLAFFIQMAFSQSNKIETTEIKTEIACDHCLKCESCDQNIFLKVKDNTKGVKSIKVDSEKNIITVKYNSEKTSLSEIEEAIALAGYKANDQEPTAEAYNQLDGCCKKK